MSHRRSTCRRDRRSGWCRGRDSNPYELALTAPSKQRVYHFHHLGPGANGILPFVIEAQARMIAGLAAALVGALLTP